MELKVSGFGVYEFRGRALGLTIKGLGFRALGFMV